jgi:hypothetical protein
MDSVSKRDRKHASFAVIRDYQPARIERELLSHAFEIVGRVLTRPEGEADGNTVAVGGTTNDPTEDCHSNAISQEKADLKYNALERAA